MADTPEFKFNGPPPGSMIGRRSPEIQAFLEVLAAHPGEWGQMPCPSVGQARSRAQYLRERHHLDATARGAVIYARSVVLEDAK